MTRRPYALFNTSAGPPIPLYTGGMPRRLTNDLLLALVLAQVATGLAGWALPIGQVLPVYGLHRALGVAVLLVLVWKQAIVRGSLRRRLARRPWDRSTLWGGLAAVCLVASLALGLAWTLNLVSFDWLWGYSPMNVHVALGIGLLPFVGWHLVRRRDANAISPPVVSRRSALRLVGLGLGTLLGWQAIERAASVVAAPGSRLVTGSKHAGSFSGNAYPITIWLFDPVPQLDATTWRLQLSGRLAAPRPLSYADLQSGFAERQLQAVLDCTSGWWSEQVWTGVGLLDVLAAAGLSETAREVTVESVTGHHYTFPLADLTEALLVTHVGGEPLTPGHGFPVRLAVPGRRGYQWVKWVARVDVA